MTVRGDQGESSRAPAVVVQGLVKSFRRRGDSTEHRVLDEVDLEVASGECVGIIGPNGAGKSTLLKLVAGVAVPCAGSVRRKADVRSLIELGAAVSPDLTGRENAEVLASIWGFDRTAVPGVVEDGLEFAELHEAIDWPVRQYSSGMVARLVFAVATARSSELLLIDEVLSVGDLAFQRKCRERLHHLRGAGTSVLLVSHDLELVAETCDRVVLLRSAVIEAEGDPAEVIRGYLGLPPEAVSMSSPEIELKALRGGPTEAGEPLDVCISTELVGEVHMDLVIPEHPTLAPAGIALSVVAGSADVAVARDQILRIDMAGLPPMKYELHATLTHEGGNSVARPLPVVLVGDPPDLCALQVDCSWTVQELEARSTVLP